MYKYHKQNHHANRLRVRSVSSTVRVHAICANIIALYIYIFRICLYLIPDAEVTHYSFASESTLFGHFTLKNSQIHIL